MKIVIFATESREAEAFDALKHGHALVLTDKPLRADNAAQYADAEIVSTFIYSKLGRFDLQGKTMGVIGTGNIGRHVIRIARGFAMRVLAYDVKPRPEFVAELGFSYASMDELLAESDIVTLHVPEAIQRIVMTTVSNIGSLLAGTPANLVAQRSEKAT